MTYAGRSPCPMLNSMANHGWLPHDGKNIDLATIQSAFLAAMGFSTESFISITQSALAVSTTGNSSTFNLQDLAHHNAIEHDGSLSRNDFFFGDDLHFNPLIWSATAARYGIRVPGTAPVITVETAARARAARVKDAQLVNPAFNLTSQTGSIGETSVFLTAFWNATAGGVPKDYARVLFGECRCSWGRTDDVLEILTISNRGGAYPVRRGLRQGKSYFGRRGRDDHCRRCRRSIKNSFTFLDKIIINFKDKQHFASHSRLAACVVGI